MHIVFLRETNPEKDKKFRKYWDTVRYKNKKSSSNMAKLYDYKLECLRFPEANYDDVMKDLVVKFGMSDTVGFIPTKEQEKKGIKKVKFSFIKKMLFKMIPGLEEANIPKEYKEKSHTERVGKNYWNGRIAMLGIIKDKFIGGTEQI